MLEHEESALRFLNKGKDEIEAEDFESASSSLFYAEELYSKLGDKENTAECALLLGNVYVKLNSFIKASKSYLEAFYLFKESPNQIKAGHSAILLGKLYRRQGSFSASIEYLEKAIQILKETKEDIFLGEAYLEMGHTYFANLHSSFVTNKQVEKAYNNAIECFSRTKNIEKTAEAQYNLGEFQLSQGLYEEANINIQSALSYFEKFEKDDQIFQAFIQLVLSHLYLGDKKRAEEFYKKGIKFMKQKEYDEKKRRQMEVLLKYFRK